MYTNYLRQRRRLCFRCGLFVCLSVCLFVCLSVCLSVGLLANLWTDFDEIFWRGRAWLKDQVIQFWWRSGSRFGSGSPKSEIRILRISGGLCCLSISSHIQCSITPCIYFINICILNIILSWTWTKNLWSWTATMCIRLHHWSLFLLFIRSVSFSDVNNTCDWRATASASADADGGSVNVHFYPAPVHFGFSIYNISLISNYFILQRLSVNTTDDVSVFIMMIIKTTVIMFRYLCSVFCLTLAPGAVKVGPALICLI